MIAAVLFDLDETLLDRTTSLQAFLSSQYDRFGKSLGSISFETWRDRFLELDQRGLAPKSSVYPAVLTEFGGDRSLANALLNDYAEKCCEHARAFPGLLETLVQLRGEGLKLGIITNGEATFQARHINALGLNAFMDAILVSETEGLRKPDAALFVRGAKRLNVSPASCLFVGDNPVADILGAHAAGMLTAWFGRGLNWPISTDPNPGASISELREVIDIVRATR